MKNWLYNAAAVLGVAPAAEGENSSGEYTGDLDGLSLTYDYTSGRSYNVKIEPTGVSYRYLTGADPSRWWGPFPYQAMKVKDNVYFFAWFEKEHDDFVTLLINLDERILHGSALLGGNEVHFHSAKIVDIQR